MVMWRRAVVMIGRVAAAIAATGVGLMTVGALVVVSGQVAGERTGPAHLMGLGVLAILVDLEFRVIAYMWTHIGVGPRRGVPPAARG